MAIVFKQSYVPYLLFLTGVVCVYLWANSRRISVEGFDATGQVAPYNFEMYYVDWCPHCHEALPEFKKLGATQTIGGTSVVCKAIEAEKNPEMVRAKVSGYPTIQLYDASGNLVKDYTGPRTTAAFQSFLEDALNR